MAGASAAHDTAAPTVTPRVKQFRISGLMLAPIKARLFSAFATMLLGGRHRSSAAALAN